MFEYASLVLTFVVFILASIEDIKKREVYDFLNYFYAFGILLIALLQSLILETSEIITSVLFGMSMGFAIGYLLFKGGLWGGGDAKFMIGFGGASVLLLQFFPFASNLSHILFFYSVHFSLFSIISTGLLLLDFLIFLFFLYRLFSEKELAHKKDLIRGLLFFSLLIFVILLQASLFLSLLFLSFSIVIFIFSDELFTKALYIKKKFKISELKEGQSLHTSIRKKEKLLLSYEEAISGIKEHHIEILKKEFSEDEELLTRWTLPLLTIIELNLLFFVFSFIFSSQLFLEITLFLLSFIFASFLLGGLAALLIIFYIILRYWNKLKVKLSKYSLVFSSLFFLVGLVFAFLFKLTFFLPFVLLALFFPFFSFAKAAETYLFVSKKKLEHIVPGDWIVEDVSISGETIYKKEEFTLGISEQQLKQLKKIEKEKNISLSFLVKDGIAFLPALFLGFLVLFFF